MSNKKDLIPPRTLKGFRDFPPALAMPREELIDKARAVFRSYGFAPIDTPALEYSEILTGKGGDESDKQMYRFADHGARDVALRFDLTVPFARFAAQTSANSAPPSSATTSARSGAGRTPSTGATASSTSATSTPSAPTPMPRISKRCSSSTTCSRPWALSALPSTSTTRLILNGLLESLGLAEASAAILRALDKLQKIGAERSPLR